MIAHIIFVRFCIFSLLKVWQNLPKKFGAWYLWGKMKSLTQHFTMGLFQTWPLKFILVFK